MTAQLTDEISSYIRAKFRNYLKGYPFKVEEPHKDLPYNLIADADWAVKVISQAYENQIYTTWTVTDYIFAIQSDGQRTGREARLMEEFPPIFEQMETLDDPALILDAEGNALVWYLPGILSPVTKVRPMTNAARRNCELAFNMQDFVWENLRLLEQSLKIHTKADSWRIDADYFEAKPGWLRAGTLSMAPAWYQQAHEKTNAMEVSAELCKKENRDWLKVMREPSALIGAVLSIIHPEQFDIGRSVNHEICRLRDGVHKGEILKEIEQHWTAPFNGISVISNRKTPSHRDTGGPYEAIDILAALGAYKEGDFQLKGLGIALEYGPGTLVGVAGRVLQHAALCDGDRACIAYYMRESVLNTYSPQKDIPWLNVMSYRRYAEGQTID